jgi:hypothetical protein
MQHAKHGHTMDSQNRTGGPRTPYNTGNKQPSRVPVVPGNLDDFHGSGLKEVAKHLQQKHEQLRRQLETDAMHDVVAVDWVPRLVPNEEYPSYQELVAAATKHLVHPGQVGHAWKTFKGAEAGQHHFSNVVAYPDDSIVISLLAPLFSRDRTASTDTPLGGSKHRNYQANRGSDGESADWARAHCYAHIYLCERVVMFTKIAR